MRYHESWQERGKKAERWMWLVTTLEQTAPEILWEMMNRRWDIEENGFHQLKTFGVITDGRVSGQKKKIQALGLEKLVNDIIITDELGGIQFRKPCDIAFRIMQHRWKIPFEQMIYVGDNVEKDFQAPKQLGMRSIFFKNKDGLYQGEDIDDIQMIDRILKLNF